MEKTDKTILDFYDYNQINYSFNRLIGLIYKDEDTQEYYHQGDFNLNLENNDKDSIYFTIPEELKYRPDTMAKFFYGYEKLYWVILEHNDIVDPFELEVGLKIEIPNYDKVIAKLEDYKELNRIKRKYL